MFFSFAANQTEIAFIVLSASTLLLLVAVILMHAKIKRFLVGDDSRSIADSLTNIQTNIKEADKFRREMEAYLETVEKRLRKSVQSVETVRFNPFQGAGLGGNQSFAAALLNQQGDGIVISTLYSRDRVSVFGKPVKAHSSEHELSEEEKLALDNAKKGLN